MPFGCVTFTGRLRASYSVVVRTLPPLSCCSRAMLRPLESVRVVVLFPLGSVTVVLNTVLPVTWSVVTA